jgi:hypothetical protein
VVIKSTTFKWKHVPQFIQVKLHQRTAEELRELDELNSAAEADQAEPILHDPETVQRRTKACNANYMPTCSFGLNCVLPTARGLPRQTDVADADASNIYASNTHDSELCVFHHRLVVYWDQQNPLIHKMVQRHVRDTGYDTNGAFQHPAPGSQDMIAVQLIHSGSLEIISGTDQPTPPTSTSRAQTLLEKHKATMLAMLVVTTVICTDTLLIPTTRRRSKPRLH